MKKMRIAMATLLALALLPGMARAAMEGDFTITLTGGGDATLNQEESRHIVKAFRAKAGDSLTLCDGKGRVAEAILTEANPQACKIAIKNISEQEEQPKIHLCVACLEGSDNEEIVFIQTLRLDVLYELLI